MFTACFVNAFLVISYLLISVYVYGCARVVGGGCGLGVAASAAPAVVVVVVVVINIVCLFFK